MLILTRHRPYTQLKTQTLHRVSIAALRGLWSPFIAGQMARVRNDAQTTIIAPIPSGTMNPFFTVDRQGLEP